MSKIREFQADLSRRCPGGGASWYGIDLHNHSPASFDYAGDRSNAVQLTVDALKADPPAILMFTDHECLPDAEFCTQIEGETGVTVLRGAEINCFVDAYDKQSDTVGRNLYYHLLLGFDPQGAHPPDYWIEELYRKCRAEHRDVGQDRKIKGIPATAAQVAQSLVV